MEWNPELQTGRIAIVRRTLDDAGTSMGRGRAIEREKQSAIQLAWMVIGFREELVKRTSIEKLSPEMS
jgi:hypothetical protein